MKVAIAHADVGTAGTLVPWDHGEGLQATFPPYPLEEVLSTDRDLQVTESSGYLAKTKGTPTYPWRVMAIARKDTELVTNPVIYLLASPSRVADTSWIKPGQVAWDWRNANKASTSRPG